MNYNTYTVYHSKKRGPTSFSTRENSKINIQIKRLFCTNHYFSNERYYNRKIITISTKWIPTNKKFR
jgi:hypothetical protein